MSQKNIRPFHIFKKIWNAFLKVIDCTQQLQVRENVVGFEKALGAVKVIKDQIQYRSQSLLNLARGYFSQAYYHSFSGPNVCLARLQMGLCRAANIFAAR